MQANNVQNQSSYIHMLGICIAIAYSSFLYSFIVFCVARADQRVQQFYNYTILFEVGSYRTACGWVVIEQRKTCLSIQ